MFGGVAALMLAVAGEAQRGQTFAPHELNNSNAPPAIV
jgi:hypothetical protein